MSHSKETLLLLPCTFFNQVYYKVNVAPPSVELSMSTFHGSPKARPVPHDVLQVSHAGPGR